MDGSDNSRVSYLNGSVQDRGTSSALALVIPRSAECYYNVVQYIMILQYSFTITATKPKSDFGLTKDTPYLTLMGNLCMECLLWG